MYNLGSRLVCKKMAFSYLFLVVFAVMSWSFEIQAAEVIGNLLSTYDFNKGTDMTGFQLKAVRFQMGSSTYTLDDVKIVLVYSGGVEATAQTWVELRTDNGNTYPSNTVITTLNPNPLTGTSFGSTPTVVTFMSSSPITLAANTNYWVVVRGGDPVNGSTLRWVANSSNTMPSNGVGTYLGYAYSSNSGSSWVNTTTYNALQVNATLNSTTLPALTTSDVADIGTTSATSGGNVTNDGGAAITARGICWSTSQNPTTSNDTKPDPSPGTGVFSSSLTGLLPGTKYYVKAYATNIVGTSYGDEKEFTTKDGDGADDVTEDSVPTPDGGTGDGNNDGIPDSAQANVTSLRTYDNNNFATFDCTAAGGTVLQNVSASSPAGAGVPAEISMPYGAFSFEIHQVTSGQVVAINIFVPRNESITGYFKKNKNTDVWEDIATSVVHDSPSVVNGKTKITIQLAEGGLYDMDSNPSTIKDPGGPGFRSSSVSVPTLNEWGMMIMGLLIFASGFFMMRRRKA